jgi:hypothetical protein
MMSLNRLVAMSFLSEGKHRPLPLLLPVPGYLIDFFYGNRFEGLEFHDAGPQLRSQGMDSKPIGADEVYSRYEAAPPDWFWIDERLSVIAALA